MADPMRPANADVPEEATVAPDALTASESAAGTEEASEAASIEAEVDDGDEAGDAQSVSPPGPDNLDAISKAATTPSPGTLLREAREARELDAADLARTMNLQPRVILALERDDYSSLPSAAFVRGYLRSYARLMGMAPEPLLAQFDASTGGVVVGVRPSPRIEYASDSVGVVQRRPGLVMAVVTLGVVAAIVAAVLMLWPRDDQQAAAPSARTSTAAAELAVASGLQAEDGATAPPSTDAGLDDELDAAAADEASSATRDEQDAGVGQGYADASDGVGSAPEAAAVVAPTAASVAAPQEPTDGIQLTRTVDGLGVRVFAGGEDHLHFTFTEECWVQIVDADDAEVYSDVARELETLDLWGRAPFRIRLGYAPAVELTYNGSRVALRPHTRNDVASLVLGR